MGLFSVLKAIFQSRKLINKDWLQGASTTVKVFFDAETIEVQLHMVCNAINDRLIGSTYQPEFLLWCRRFRNEIMAGDSGTVRRSV